MVLEFLQSLSEMQLVGELTVLSLLIGGIIMAGGVIIAKIAKLLFHKYYAPSLPKDTAQNISKLIYFGILVISFLGFTSSQGIDLSGIMVAGGIFAVVIGFATQSVVSNLISGLFLIVEKPAKHGDTIELPDMGISGVKWVLMGKSSDYLLLQDYQSLSILLHRSSMVYLVNI